MRRILIIEDNYDLSDNICLLLSEHKYNVLQSFNGEDGLKSIINFKPDLIFCDIMLPDINGYKILIELKKLNEKIAPIFIFLTAKTQREELRKGMTLGADDYITKPFTNDELLEAVSAQFKKRAEVLKKINVPHLQISKNDRVITRSDKSNSGYEKGRLSFGDHLFINDKKKPGFYLIENILLIKSMKDYTQLFFIDDKKFLLRKRMIYWENKLPKEWFLRIHRQTLINLKYVDQVEKISSNRFSISIKNYSKKLEASQRCSQKLKNILH